MAKNIFNCTMYYNSASFLNEKMVINSIAMTILTCLESGSSCSCTDPFMKEPHSVLMLINLNSLSLLLMSSATNFDSTHCVLTFQQIGHSIETLYKFLGGKSILL
jgi:hypothetical protein